MCWKKSIRTKLCPLWHQLNLQSNFCSERFESTESTFALAMQKLGLLICESGAKSERQRARWVKGQVWRCSTMGTNWVQNQSTHKGWRVTESNSRRNTIMDARNLIKFSSSQWLRRAHTKPVPRIIPQELPPSLYLTSIMRRQLGH